MLSKWLLIREGESAYAKEQAEKRMLGHVLTDHPSRYHNIMQILPDVSPEDGDHGSYGNSYGDYSPALQRWMRYYVVDTFSHFFFSSFFQLHSQ